MQRILSVETLIQHVRYGLRQHRPAQLRGAGVIWSGDPLEPAGHSRESESSPTTAHFQRLAE